MAEYTAILDYLEKNLSKNRFNHSINVSKEAVKLSKVYGCDIEKVKLAGIVHDCAKDMELEKQMHYAKNCGFFVDDLTYKIPELIHAPASAYLCKTVLGINDIEVLSSIRYHTTGKADMSLLEKIIFIADFIEPGRDFEKIERLRETAYKNIDEALLYALNSSIIYIIKNKLLLHPDTVKARNYILDILC